MDSVFSNVDRAPEDPILGVTVAYNNDPSPAKLNLGVGAYRTEEGKPLVLDVVRRAEQQLVNDPSRVKEYIPIAGLADFNKLSAKLILGADSPAIQESRVATIQCLSGTGSLRVGSEFLKKHYHQCVIFIPKPTWGNHPKVFNLAGLSVEYYRYYDPATRGLDFQGLLEDLGAAPSGAIVLLHACAHNPTGVDPTSEQWEQIRQLIRSKSLLPFFDSAYQGFASGSLDTDAHSVRTFVADGGECLIAQSYAKNMGLYGERVGALSIVCKSADVASKVESQVKLVVRPMYSSPPIHGASIVATILKSRCMHLRSRGPSNLVPRAADIRALERECARKRREEEQQAHLQRLDTDMGDIPQNQQRAARPIGTYDRPNIHGHRLGIRAPAVAANNFEIKSGLLNVIENNKYHGLALEDPFDHLDRFDSYCGLSKTNGVSEDALKLKLFPFSLGDKARQWEKSLPSDSITTWDDCKKAFLEKFFSTSRTAKLRNEISSFQQKNLEGFSEAWERFKGYQAQCPHHGFSKESLLSTFYRGALPKYRARLDTASNGFFLGRTEEDAEELVDNMVKSDAVYSGDHDRGSRTDDKQTRKEIKALEDKIDLLIAEKATQEQLKFVGNSRQEDPLAVNEVEGLEGQEELCFINNNGSWYKKEPNFQYNNYQQKSYPNNQQSGYPPRNNQQGSYQPQQNPSSGSSAPQESSTDTLLKQILESQTRSEKHVGYELKNLHTKIDGSYNELNNKFSHLASTVRNLENQFASMNTHQNRQQGSLPGKSDQNPKEAKAITLRSGKQLPPKTLTKDAEKLGEGVAINIDDEVVIVDEKINDEILEKIVEAKGKGKVGEEKKTVKDGEVVTPASESSFVPPPYEPKLPFPGRFKRQLLEKYKALFEKQMSEAQVAMPIIDAFMLIPQYSKFLKDAVAAKKKEMEGMMILTHECNAIIQRLDASEKLEDPGSFTLPCALGPMVFEKSLCDLGASVSLMPLSVAKKLGFTQFKKCRLSLVLADRSVKYPVGILEDLPVKIGRYEIPTDFVVLEMGEEAQDPLILGRPFLATAGAIVNVKEGTIDLHLGKENILHFDIKRKMRKPTVFGQAFYIEEMDTPADEHLEELPPEDDEEGSSPSTHSP